MAEKQSVKFSDEEMQKVKQLQEGYQAKIVEFGDLRIAKIAIKQQWDHLNNLEVELEKQYLELQKGEKSLGEELNKKYGNGVLNLDTGEFLPE